MWKHVRFSKAEFKGNYERDSKGERIFVLTSAKRRLVFESWQAARLQGWKLF